MAVKSNLNFVKRPELFAGQGPVGDFPRPTLLLTLLALGTIIPRRPGPTVTLAP